ncbi:MAG: Crp/Fnr family transcriptional regulator [Alphaproteobacteria bacterium]
MRLNIEKIETAKNSTIFSFVPEEALVDLLDACNIVLLNPGETLIAAKTSPEAVFIVFKGSLEIHNSNGDSRTLGKNDCIGFLEMMESKETDFFAIATEESEIIKINKETLILEIESNPELSLGLIRSLCHLINSK